MNYFNRIIKMEVTKDLLYQFFEENKNQEKFDKYMEVFKSFSKEKQGRSGAEVGSIGDNYVMKISTIKFTSKSIIDNQCLFLKSQINEIFINYVLTNLNKFTKLSEKELKLKNKYLLKIKDFGLSNNKSYIINDKVGVNIQNKYMTNVSEVLKFNHLPKIKKNKNLIDKYQLYLISKVIRPLDDILLMLHKKIKFYHTDFKLDNVFIKEHNIRGYETLKEKGLFLNFIPLLSDLDKSRISLRGKKILPIDDKKRISKIGKILGYEPLLSLRYDCRIKYGKEKCIKFRSEDFDILLIFINIYLLLYIFELNDLFEILDDYVKNRFSFKEDDMIKFKQVIKKNSTGFSFLNKLSATKMSGIIYQICKKLEY